MSRSRPPTIATVLAAAALLAASLPNTTGALPLAAPAPPAPAPIPLRVEQVATGLTNPWDTALLPDGQLLVTQRPGKLTLIDNGQPRDVQADLTDVYAQGEGGLLGLAAAPDFATSRTFVTCHSHQEQGRPVDNRLVAWRLSEDGATAERTADPLMAALPLNPSGRHSGCRPTFGADGMLLVGTGDSARGDVAQDTNSMGGKVLRLDPATGAAAPGNPFADSPDEHHQRAYTLGHRNVQGIAVEPGTDRIWAIEHGPDIDDEITALTAGGNGGWDPAGGPEGYDEAVPMTDLEKFPDATPPAFTSGDSTVATSGAAFLGPDWGTDAGVLAVAALKGQQLLLMRTADGRVTSTQTPPELDQQFGRLRSVRSEGGALWVTSDNGNGQDVVLRVTRR